MDVDTDNSELSASTASNTTLPHLEATDAERALNENGRRRRKEARKLKREAREKKKEEQQLEDKKQRKEEKKLKREARRKKEKLGKRRKKKRRQKMHHQVAYQVVLKIEMMMSPTKCRKGARKRRKERAKLTPITNMLPYPLTTTLCL